MSKKLIISKKSVIMALTIARKKGLAIGSTATHLRDGRVYYLAEIKDDVAVLRLSADQSPTGEELIKEFPLWEVYDPNVALKLSLPALNRRRAPRWLGDFN